MGKFTTLLRATGLSLALALPAAAQDADTVLATVNGNDITLGHVIALMDRLPEQYQTLDDQRLYDGILEQLISQAAMADQARAALDKAAALGLENEINTFLANVFISNAAAGTISEAQIKEVYDAQFEGFEAEEEFNAAHILVETEEEALEIITMLDGGADFGTLAKERSTGPSGPRGGDLGFFGRGQMVPAFENAVIALEDGAYSPPVETQFGWHVVKRVTSRMTGAPALDEVREDIEQGLRSDLVSQKAADAEAEADISRTVIEVDPSLIRNKELLSQ
ncbi:MAG: peptidylprolyl isomerase [Pseudomonadota bacterium]